ncbi:Hypothetical predicted protein [Cloeon dipterum]|uniref:Uncharacterized protein n=1 Tax=Cloeon dipterum TaxID=197152 RepID=A0A8S1DB08_9INSE|nr:Hypothetical predicted protein [Cloeon dipterum]
MKLAKTINAMRLSGIPSELCKNYATLVKSKKFTYKNIKWYLLKLTACGVDSSKTLEVLKDLFDRITITKIRFNEVFTLYPLVPDFVFKVLQLITSTYSTSLSSFTIYSSDENDLESVPKLGEAMWREIAKLQNLRQLIINKFYITIGDLMKMCRNMPQLEIIILVIDAESHLPIDNEEFANQFSHNFGRIQEFWFDLTQREDDSEVDWSPDDLINFSIKHLPELAFIGSKNWKSNMSAACIEINFTSKLKRLELTAFNLEEVAKNFDKFPSLTSLIIMFDLAKDRNYDHPLSKELKNFLNVFGRNLKRLVIDYTREHPAMTLDLKIIKDMCSKLQELNVRMTNVIFKQLTTASFKSLRGLYIDFLSDCRALNLSCLLAPPNLRTVVLRGFRVTVQEFKETIKQFTTKRILTKLELLELQVMILCVPHF